MSHVYDGMGDYEAFAQDNLGRFLRYAVMLTGERELAADLVQDVMVKVFRQWQRIDATEHPYRYVLRMITNEHLSWRRRWSVRSVVAVADLPERGDSADLQALQALRDDLWQRLAGLPRRQRAVLVLRYYEQLTDAEIAAVLECSPTTVRGYVHRGLATLRAGMATELRTATEGA